MVACDTINFFDFLVRDDDGVLMGLLQKGDTVDWNLVPLISVELMVVVYEICIYACFVTLLVTSNCASLRSIR